MPFRSVRRKIVSGLLAGTFFIALVMVVFAETVIRQRLRTLLQEKGVAIARRVAADSISPVITERYFEIAMMFKDLQGAELGLVYAFILSEDGRELVHTFPNSVPPELKLAHPVDPLRPFSARELNTDKGSVLDIGVPLLRGQAGVLHIGLSETAINRDVNRVVFLILLVMIVALAVGSASAIGLSRIITRPLVALAGAAEAFGQGKTGQPLAITSEDELGGLARAFNVMVANRQRAEEERERLIEELRQTLSEVKTLRGFLPICSSCKKIRSDQGSWQQLESYIRDHTDAEFSHGICPECARALYPEQWQQIQHKAGA